MPVGVRELWSAYDKQSALQEAHVEHSPERVLLVEDDGEMRAFLAELLSHSGYEVIQATDGLEAIRILAEDQRQRSGELQTAIEAVVTDARMPGATGLEVLEYLRARDWQTGVVLISAFATEDLREEARRLGAAAVLAKPFTILDFLRSVDEVVQRP